MNKTLVVTGPESSGKTSLARLLSKELELPILEEYSREYLSNHGPEYDFDDVIKMAREQLNRERQTLENYSSQCILDTDMMVYSIWIKEKYNTQVSFIRYAIENSSNKLYLLCAPDLDWEDDGLRENPNLVDRKRLFDTYKAIIEKYGYQYHIIRGKGDERLKNALKSIKI